jgi:flagellar biosynthesis GTPase FlhF
LNKYSINELKKICKHLQYLFKKYEEKKKQLAKKKVRKTKPTKFTIIEKKESPEKFPIISHHESPFSSARSSPKLSPKLSPKAQELINDLSDAAKEDIVDTLNRSNSPKEALKNLEPSTKEELNEKLKASPQKNKSFFEQLFSWIPAETSPTHVG